MAWGVVVGFNGVGGWCAGCRVQLAIGRLWRGNFHGETGGTGQEKQAGPKQGPGPFVDCLVELGDAAGPSRVPHTCTYVGFPSALYAVHRHPSLAATGELCPASRSLSRDPETAPDIVQVSPRSSELQSTWTRQAVCSRSAEASNRLHVSANAHDLPPTGLHTWILYTER